MMGVFGGTGKKAKMGDDAGTAAMAYKENSATVNK
jgi:hypothetical protein